MPHPIRTPYTVPYGAQFGAPREGGRHHQGTDYHCPIGTPIYGTGAGGRVVANVGETGVGIGFGNYVSVLYPGGRMTLDGHLVERSPLSVGTPVGPDTVVGGVGITGNAIYASPPGSHDHHQVWLNGNLADPETVYGPVLADAGATIIDATKEDPMSYTIFTVADNGGGGIWVRSLITGAIAHIQSPYHVSLLQRYKIDNTDSMLSIECAIVAGYLTAIHSTITDHSSDSTPAINAARDMLRADLGSIRGDNVNTSLTELLGAIRAAAPILTDAQLAIIGQNISTHDLTLTLTGKAVST